MVVWSFDEDTQERFGGSGTDPSVKATVGASSKEDTPFEARRTAVRVGL